MAHIQFQTINSYKVPWLYWQLITNPDPHQGQDYEVCTGFTFIIISLALNLDILYRSKSMAQIGIPSPAHPRLLLPSQALRLILAHHLHCE